MFFAARFPLLDRGGRNTGHERAVLFDHREIAGHEDLRMTGHAQIGRHFHAPHFVERHAERLRER